MLKNLLLPLLFLFIGVNAFSQSFNSIWNTSNTSPGSSADNEITIPTNPAFTNYNYSVDWGDGATDPAVTGDITHTYATSGIYTISISGTFPAIYFNNANDKLKIIEILQWGDIQWQSMEDAFHGCARLNFDAIDSPDLTQVTSLKNMFARGELFNGIVNDWDVSTITDISGMFSDAEIFNRPLNKWDTSAITDMSNTFNDASLFNEPLDNWKTATVTNMEGMFYDADKFNQDINNWNVANVTNMANLFLSAGAFNQPLNNWNVSSVTNMSRMFASTPFNQPINSWVVDNVTDMSSMFSSNNYNYPLDNWNVSNVTTIAGMFASNTRFNQNINNWNVSNVTNMSNTFGSAGSLKDFNQPLDQWDVSNVTTMAGMFRSSSFNQSINSWDVSSVTDMSDMFAGWASVYFTVFDQPLDTWNVTNVINMSDMFADSNFNQSIEIWDVSNVVNMNSMFENALNFNQPLNNWSTSSLSSITRMFSDTPVFNQPLNNWDTSGITNMSTTFSNAQSFDQNLSSWNITSASTMSNMLSNSALSQENYDNTLISWAAQSVNSGVSLGATAIKYCDGRLARQSLIDNHGWNITGDIVNCTNVFCTTITNPKAGDTNVPANSNIHWAAAPNATGYYIDLEVERAGTRSFVNINGSPANNYDVGNVQILTFTNEFTPGDTIYITVTPYNDEGPATGCEEFSFTVVPSWVNSPAAYKLKIDTTIDDPVGNIRARQFEMERNSSYSYNYSIDWGDNEYDNNVSSDIVHTYNVPGEYIIAIIGDFPAPYFGTFGDGEEVLSIEQWGTHEYQSMRRACYECKNMEYNATDIPNLTQVTDMSEMFEDAAKFNGNINNWDVSNVTTMKELFNGNTIFNQPLNSWNTSKVTDMSAMFFRAAKFNQPLNIWNTSMLTTISGMFNGAKEFNQPLNNWDVSNVEGMSTVFANTDNFNQNIDNWNVSSATIMNAMFYNAAVFNQPLNSWSVDNVMDMNFMFNGALVFNQPLDTWNVSKVINMASMFERAESFNQSIDIWNVAMVTNMSSMFDDAKTFNQPLNSWSVSRVTTMASMFKDALVFDGSIENWNVNSVVNMSSMFENAQVFNQPLNTWNVSAVANMSSMFKNALLFDQSLNLWDVSSVTLMPSMFEGAATFNATLDIWNVASVTNMQAMFKNASLFNQTLPNWDTGEVLTMREMFKGATAFNQPIDTWDTSFVTTMEGMFEEATTFNQPLNSWNTASVITMEDMFKGATSFNEVIDAWNVRGVDTMEEMFSGATSFNQSINDWRVSGVSNMNYMFNGASSYNQPMNLWNLGNVSMRSAFYNATALNQYLGDWNVSNVSDMRDMLDNTALIRENYDNTLIAWSEQTLTSGITLGAEGLPYCDAQEERQSMIDTYGWSFSLDVRDCPIPDCTQLASPLNGDTDVPVNTNITWDAALYAQGYRLTVGTTAGGNDIVNNETITNETTFEFTSDFNTGDDVFVTIIPFNDEGDAVGPCIEERFTISTDPATIPECTDLTEPLDNANDVLVTTDLSWNPISNADGYKLTVGTTMGGTDILNAEDVGNVTTYDLATNLPEDSDIFVTITPYNDEGDATSCTVERFHTELIPVPPVCTNLNVPINNATDVPIDTPLTWDAVSNATGYLVIVGTTSGGIEVVNNIDVGNQTTYDIPNDLQEDRLHYVTIIPYNDEGDATGCVEETFKTGNSTSPPSCTTLTTPTHDATAVDPSTNLTWTELSSATGYKLSVGTTSGGSDIFTGDVMNVLTYDLASDLPESTPIYVTVTPYNENGDAIGCSEESFTTDGPPLCTTLISPANLATDVAVDTSIEWNASTNADGYKLTVTASSSTANNLTDFDVTSGTTYDFTSNFERGETVTVTIVPYNSVGDATGPCTSESFTIIPPPVPACTTLISPANNASNVAVDTGIEWNASTGADGYKLTVSASTSTANNVTDLDIPTGTTYSFANDFEQGETVSVTIVPYNDQGDAIGCTSESFTIKPVPSCNSLIMPGDEAVDVAVDTDISWSIVSDATGYRLSVSGSSSTANNITAVDITSGNTYDFPNDFEQGETVTVTIVPYNEVGDAIGCAPESFTIKPVPSCTNLTAPADEAVNIAVDTDITWNAISDATGYNVTVSASTSTANNGTFDVTGNTYEFPSDFEQGEMVTVTIVPYNEVGNAIGCTSESFTIKPIPLCTNLNAPADGDIDLPVDTNITWNAVTDANGYRLTVTASSSTANNGTFNITTGNSYDFLNDFEQSETVTVTIVPYNEVGDAIGCSSESFTIKSVPLCTNLTAPADGDIVAEVNEITWNPIVDADGYKLTISATNTTSNNVTDFEVSGTTYVFPNDFNQGEVITVTITPFNEVGDAIGCTSESFTIRPIPPCTELVDSLNGATEVSVATDISWNASFDADGYRISVGTSPNGTDIVNDEDLASLMNYTFAEDLPSETLIYVTITPYNTSGDALGCTSNSFETEVIIPECTALTTPFNGEVEVDLETSISWDEVEKTNGYRISIGTTSGGNDIVDNLDVGPTTNYQHTGEYPFGTEIFVSILPYNSKGECGTMCAIFVYHFGSR